MSSSTVPRQWLAECCHFTFPYSSNVTKSSGFIIRFKLRYTLHVLGVEFIRPTPTGVDHSLLCIIGLSLLLYPLYLISFACFLVLLGGGIFLAGVSLSSFLRLYVDMISLYIFIGSVFFVGGAVSVLVQDEMNIMFTARNPKSYSIVIS